MIINKSSGHPRWFRCKDGDSAMVVDYGNGFRISTRKGSSGVFYDWGTDIDFLVSKIGPVNWPVPDLPPLDLSGWEQKELHVVGTRNGQRRIAYRDGDYIFACQMDCGPDKLWLNGRWSANGGITDIDIIADYGPLDDLELKEKK